MEESILALVKKSIGIDPSYTVFDIDLITHINSVFMALTQLGIGPAKGFRIEDDSDEWTDFIPVDDLRFEAVKSYVCLKVRLLFDPPSGSVILGCIKEQISELEWRLFMAAES